MDEFHKRLAKVALGVAAEYGFCLAGGYAVHDGRYTGLELLQMAAEHDPGFDRLMFGEALRA